jgi:hypothetical protein
MWIAIDRPGYSHARRNDGQNITPHVGGLDVLHRSPMAKRLPVLLRARAAEIGPSRHFAALQQTVAFGGKADIERQFFGAVATRLFSKKDFVGRPHCATPTRPSFGHAASYSAFPHQVRRAVLPLEKAPTPTLRD